MIFPPTINLHVPDDAPGDLILGWRTVHPDLRSGHGYRYPFPGQWAEAPGPILNHRGSCPKAVGDGICVAHTWPGARSGGIRSTTWLLVGYRPGDVLGDDEPGKVRVSRMLVLDVFGPAAVIGPRANLVRADLTRANLSGANLTWVDLGEANLTGANLGEANLTGANLTGVDLGEANLTGANLGEANLTGANLGEANLTWADLTKANLTGANLVRADLTWADLTKANLTGANLVRADLTRANLGEANLTWADLTKANLTRANLSGANLTRANLSGANLTKANLTRARGDQWTRLPGGWRVSDGLIVRADAQEHRA